MRPPFQESQSGRENSVVKTLGPLTDFPSGTSGKQPVQEMQEMRV